MAPKYNVFADRSLAWCAVPTRWVQSKNIYIADSLFESEIQNRLLLWL